MVEFEELRLLWKPYEELKNPPAEKIRLWSAGGCGIWISDEWGPAVPYPAVDHGNGNLNHGYRRLKGIGGAVSLIPEARDWPELQKFLETVNAESSPIESVGCEKAFFTDEKNTPPISAGKSPPTGKSSGECCRRLRQVVGDCFACTAAREDSSGSGCSVGSNDSCHESRSN